MVEIKELFGLSTSTTAAILTATARLSSKAAQSQNASNNKQT